MDKKNTLLLTVIAVATLLVAVVGATFAYFTAQGGDTVEKAVTVKTNTTNSALFNVANQITIRADESNFGAGQTIPEEDRKTTGTATFTASDAAAADFCYTVSLTVTDNDFKKCAEDEKCNSNTAVTDKNAKELTFTAKKGSATLVDAVDITKGKATVQVPTAVPTEGATPNYIHKIHAEAGAKVTDNWEFIVDFINLNHDQEYNTGKTFNGSIVFAKATCSESSPQVKYWNDEFGNNTYSFPNTPSTTYASITKLQAGYSNFASKPYYIKTTTTENQACLYYNNREFCLGANYWDTDVDTTKQKLQIAMATALGVSESDLSCSLDSGSVDCVLFNFRCGVSPSGGVGCRDDYSRCGVFGNGAAYCR